ncbi:MAG: metallophosphoesterase, partial [Sphingobacteriales bacterium]|nr:metallophosphoesterase [Sphingobacteriales bacterium]
MRQLLQKIFRPFFIWLAIKFSSSPKRADVFKSLSKLYSNLQSEKSKRGIVLDINIVTDKFIIFSDQHKGVKDWADDFKDNEPNYLFALEYYYKQGYSYINLGDCEELWKNKAETVLPLNQLSLQAEAAFQKVKKYYRTFGNHDLLWKNKLDVAMLLKDYFQMPLPVYEGIILRTTIAGHDIKILLTHGHQGDKLSDNNAFSTWIVAHIWAPIQRYLQININTPSTDLYLRDKHNRLMYEWSSEKKDTLLITGHTHKPVFASGKYSYDDGHKIEIADSIKNTKASYFNTGCCCYNDGDITGIELADGYMRLIKW